MCWDESGLSSARFIFAVASALASSAKTMGALICFRGMQGLGAGGIMPVVLTILGDIFTLEERAAVQGFFSAIWGSAALAGPALGAFLVSTLGWRSIFFVNLPAGILGLLVLVWKYHDHEKPHSTDLDLPGFATLAVACTATLLLASGLVPGARVLGWDIVLFIVATLTTLAFAHIERRAANPIMPPALMMQRAIGPAMLASFLLGCGFLSLDTYVPLYVQGGRGGGVVAAAKVVTPVMLTWASSGVIAAPLVVRWGFRQPALLGSSIVIVGFVGLLGLRIDSRPAMDDHRRVGSNRLRLRPGVDGVICWRRSTRLRGSNAASSPAESSSSAPSAGRWAPG